MIKSTAILLEELKRIIKNLNVKISLMVKEKAFPYYKGLYETDPSIPGLLLKLLSFMGLL